jgi:hypothetical protein
MEAKVSPKRRDNLPTPGGDILEDIKDCFKYTFFIRSAPYDFMYILFCSIVPSNWELQLEKSQKERCLNRL